MSFTKDGSTKSRPDVAVYLDFENLYVSLKTTAKMEPNFELLMERCREFGRVTVCRAYADWSEFARMFTSQMFANGIEPVYVPTRKVYDSNTRGPARKNSVDIHITIDIIKSLFLFENIDVIILISGDRDYVPLINEIRQKGKAVYAIGVAGCTSSELSIAVDEMFFYHQLLENEDRKPEVVDVYNQLLAAIRTARRRGYPTTLGILKPIMKELIQNFNERSYKNSRGIPFQKFKDLVEEAERRHLVKLVTSGGSNEVLLWAEPETKATAAAGNGATTSGRVATVRPNGSDGRPESMRGRRRRPERRPEEQVDGDQHLDEDSVPRLVTVEATDGAAGNSESDGDSAEQTVETGGSRRRSRSRRRPGRSRSRAAGTDPQGSTDGDGGEHEPTHDGGGDEFDGRGQQAESFAGQAHGYDTESPGSDGDGADHRDRPSRTVASEVGDHGGYGRAQPHHPDHDHDHDDHDSHNDHADHDDGDFDPSAPISVNEAWGAVQQAVASFGDKPPTPRKLIGELKKARIAGAFGQRMPTDDDLDELLNQCVETGRLRRERKGFSTVLRLLEPTAEGR